MEKLTSKKPRGWYWREHTYEYERASVEKDIRRFVGWNFLLKLIEECNHTLYRTDQVELLRKRDKGLIAALFLTGGRVGEVVRLRKKNFDFEEGKEKGVIVVQDMPSIKRWRKVGEWVEELDPEEYQALTSLTKRGLYTWDKDEEKYVRNRWDMIPAEEVRDDFPIWLDEPLIPYFLEWHNQAEDYLFPAGKRRMHKEPYMSETRAYQIVTDLGERLAEKAEADEPLREFKGFHLWNHWFRSQRAHQLAKERKYDKWRLMRFFGWVSYKTAEIYAKAPWELLV